MNTDLLLKIKAAILAAPENFDMGSFVSPGDAHCGTTMCIAGWAVHLSDFDTSAVHAALSGAQFENLAGWLLGVEDRTRFLLFFGAMGESGGRGAAMAARVIDRLIEEGVVSWEQARNEYFAGYLETAA